MDSQKIKSKIKRLSKEFNFHYKSEWFKHLWISKKENILTEYIWMCPDPVYTKYGKIPSERIDNIKKFIDSDEFQSLTNRYGGQVIERKSFNQFFLKRINSIKDKKIMKECSKIYKKIKNAIRGRANIAILTKTSKKKEEEFVTKFILMHEWIHILLFKNKISFKKYNGKYWQYDEGLCTFCEGFLGNSLDKLEDKAEKMKYPMEKQYYIYAIKFRDLLKNEREPEKRKKIILKLKDKLK